MMALDQKTSRAFEAFIGIIVRRSLMVVATYFGMSAMAAENTVDAIVPTIIGAVLALGSVAWSYVTRRYLAKAEPRKVEF